MSRIKNTSPAASGPLSSILFSQIQKDILSGEMRQGEKLTEQKLCERYKVSRTPIREALRQLENEGLIENIPNRGAFVIGISRQDLSDMMELRIFYEVLAVKWAIERMTDNERETLEETFDFMEFYTKKGDVDKMISINTTFHNLIHQGTHSRMLQQTLASYQLYLKYASSYSTMELNDYLLLVFQEHKAVFEAMRDRDIDKACVAMRVHMENSRARRLKTL